MNYTITDLTFFSNFFKSQKFYNTYNVHIIKNNKKLFNICIFCNEKIWSIKKEFLNLQSQIANY